MFRVLIVDDHELFRETARRVPAASGFDVVAGAADGAEALRLARELRPDVILLDVQRPDTDGFAVAQEPSGSQSSPAVVLVSGRSRSDHGGLVERSGVRGFIDKADLSGQRLRQELGSTEDCPLRTCRAASTRRESAGVAGVRGHPAGHGHRYLEDLVPAWAGVLGLDPTADRSRVQQSIERNHHPG